jgi:peptidoglycan hydrolase-like protein with peptidoglycan-binding domain
MVRPSPRRRTLVRVTVVAFALVVLIATPAAAALAPFYPTQSLGDRGTDVTAIQLLFRAAQNGTPRANARGVVAGARNPLTLPISGVFDPATAAAIKTFQGARGLPTTGIVDPPTWDQLVVEIGPFSTGDAVVALQRELLEKRGASTGGTDGVYGAQTAADVRAFQAHMGLPQTGVADVATWRSLIWHFEEPLFSAAALCDYDPPANANWGTAEMIATLEAAGAVMVGAGYGRVAVGDLGYEHGGDHPEHATHEVGLDADLRMMRKANNQCSSPSTWRSSAYDRAATRFLVKTIRRATPGHVKEILFNDPVLIREGLTVFAAGHDDHLHVRLCEPGHPVRLYRCP